MLQIDNLNDHIADLDYCFRGHHISTVASSLAQKQQSGKQVLEILLMRLQATDEISSVAN